MKTNFQRLKGAISKGEIYLRYVSEMKEVIENMEIKGHVTDLGKSVLVHDFNVPDFHAFSNITMLKILIFINNSG